MNLINYNSKQVHQLKRYLADSVSNRHICNLHIRMMNFFKKEVILGPIYLRQATPVKIYLIADWTLVRF